MVTPSARSTVIYKTSRYHKSESHILDKHHSEDFIPYILMNVFIFGIQAILYNLMVIK
jgi:hypothetical protein